MREQLIASFPNRPVRYCLESESCSVFYVYESDDDKEKKCVILSKNSKIPRLSLKVKNAGEKEIFHLPVDGCFMSSKDGDRCDSVLFDDKIFSFLEFKLNISKTKGLSKKLKKGIEQLEKTIQLFDSAFRRNKKDYLGMKKEAAILTGVSISPRAKAGRDLDLLRFKEEYKTELKFIDNQFENGNLKNEWLIEF